MSSKLFLVLGGTGKIGRRVAERLWERGMPIRVGSRTADRPFDWERPETWDAALEGVEAAFVSYYPDLAAPDAVDAVRSFSSLAVARGVRRLVLLSGRGEPEAQRCEQIVQRSGALWTVVRASWFSQNFSEGHFLEPILDGTVALPAGAVREPFVDADDVADVAAAALIDEWHAGQIYEVTGPRLWTFKDAVAAIAAATGRDIRFVELAPRDYPAVLRNAGVPRDVAALIMYLFTEVLDGRNASVQDGVRRALGRAARDFDDYVLHTAASGVWGAGEAGRPSARPAQPLVAQSESAR